MRESYPLVDNVPEGVPGAAQQSEDRHQPACGIELLALQDGVDHEQNRDQFEGKDDSGEDGICNLNGDCSNIKAKGESQGTVKKSNQYADASSDPHQTHKFCVRIELQQIDQQEPLAELSKGDPGLDEPGQPDAGHGKAQPTQYQLQNRHERVGRHPEQQPLLAVSEPRNEAEYGCQSVERREAEEELPAAQPTEIEGLFLGPDRLRAAG